MTAMEFLYGHHERHFGNSANKVPYILAALIERAHELKSCFFKGEYHSFTA